MNSGPHRWRLIAIPLLLGLIAGACGSSDDGGAANTSVTVMATTTVLGDVAANVAGTGAAVEVLMPVGADPHDFQPSSEQIAALNSADLVIANGLGLEAGLGDVLEAAANDGVRILELAPLLDPIQLGLESDHEDNEAHEEEADHGSMDPHVWLDPLRMAKGARVIAAELEDIAPGGDWSARADAYAGDLTTADDRIAGLLASVPVERRALVTNHDSLSYFAERYDFEVIGTVIPTGATLSDPSSGELAELIEVMRREGVTVIFGETTQPEALGDAVAAELGQDANVVDLYTGSLGEPGSGAETLIGMLELNAMRIAAALGA